MKIFIVEDDKELNNSICDTFISLGYDVSSFTDGKDAFINIDNSYDLYMVDINLPHINGIELVKQIKKIKNDAKIFVVSAEIEIDTIIQAYDLGCADYIKKPFDLREIIAKITHTLEVAPHIYTIKGCGEYNKNERLFKTGNEEILLTKKEALLMEILLKNANKTISNEQIEVYIWGTIKNGGNVRQLVAKIRQKIPYDFIENHASSGYKLVM